jgi:WD40 repeat protein
MGGGAPQPDGTMWVLAGSSQDRTIQKLNLTSGKVLRILPVGGTASSIAESSTGTLAVGYANPQGTVEFRDAGTGSVVSSVGVGQPVKDLAPEGQTSTFFVLDGTSSATTVNKVSPNGPAVQSAIGVELGSVAIAPTADGSHAYLLQTSGSVVYFPIAGGKSTPAISQFYAGAGAVQLALSPDGSTLFVLKVLNGDANVGVFNLATDSQERVLPAAAGTVDLQPSLDGSHLYLLVGMPTVGNIQVESIG